MRPVLAGRETLLPNPPMPAWKGQASAAAGLGCPGGSRVWSAEPSLGSASQPHHTLRPATLQGVRTPLAATTPRCSAVTAGATSTSTAGRTWAWWLRRRGSSCAAPSGLEWVVWQPMACSRDAKPGLSAGILQTAAPPLRRWLYSQWPDHPSQLRPNLRWALEQHGLKPSEPMSAHDVPAHPAHTPPVPHPGPPRP